MSLRDLSFPLKVKGKITYSYISHGTKSVFQNDVKTPQLHALPASNLKVSVLLRDMSLSTRDTRLSCKNEIYSFCILIGAQKCIKNAIKILCRHVLGH